MNKHSSEYWAHYFDVTVMDPDGWDRQNFERSWNEPISESEFHNRLVQSTVLGTHVFMKAVE